ncbi:hypothetical protein MT068_001380 [Salmonella enterica]|nr:hypothetical protein [Salmonella enterica]
MTKLQFFYTLGLNALVSLAISVGVTDYMLNQRDKAEAEEVVVIGPRIKEDAERNKLFAEANVLIKQIDLDTELSKYSGVEVVDAYKMDDIIEVKLQIAEGKKFCSINNADLQKIKFYKMTSPYIKCSNGVTD